MRHPPEALYSFTIPSINDDTPLNCRVYHPDTLSEAPCDSAGLARPDRARGIVMAHPYAPMGGSYEDRVVSIVVDEFLKAGWIVGTFNFRYGFRECIVRQESAVDKPKRCTRFQRPYKLVWATRARRLHLLCRILHALHVLYTA
jgi:hypothetical protein